MNITDAKENTITWFILSPLEEIVYRITTLTLVSIGITVNLFLLYLYYVKLISRTHFNYFLLHLSVANIVLYIGFIPYVVLDVRGFSEINDHRAVYLLCSLKDGLTIFFIAANFTVYTLCLMTYIRYKLIRYPLKAHEVSSMNQNRWIASFWFLSFLSMSPNFFTLNAYDKKPFCLRTYPFGKIFLQLFGLVTVSVGFIIPVAIFSVTYSLVVFQLFFQKELKTTVKNASKSRLKYRKKIVQVLGVIVVGFVFCWLPFMCAWMISIFGYFDQSMEDEIKKARMYRFVSLPSLCTGIINVFCNIASSTKFRKYIMSRRSRRIAGTVSFRVTTTSAV